MPARAASSAPYSEQQSAAYRVLRSFTVSPRILHQCSVKLVVVPGVIAPLQTRNISVACHARDDVPDADGLALARRFSTEFQTREVQSGFDGRALALLIHRKYGRMYDVILVQRKVLGKVFVAMNIMWRFLGQQSFGKNEEQYIRNLDGVASVLTSWGVAGQVVSELQGVKSKPRVGKAVSIQIKVDPDKLNEWTR